MRRARNGGLGGLALGALAALAPAAAGAQYALERVVPDALARPTFATSAPGDPSRLFYLEQHTGNVRIIDRATSSVLADPFLTVPDVSLGAEQGLLGLAFHPDYAANGLFYLNRTDASGDTRIERYQVSADPNRALATPTELLFIDQPQANHNGGWLGFGPDGYLYAGTGDGGNFNDTGTGHTADTGNAQDTTDNLLGKILRFDVSSAPLPGLIYAVPASNPFVGVEGDDLIWAYGLRNPWRNSFDRETGDLWIGDVGQNRVEEIDFQPAASAGGENYGWRLREGSGETPGIGVGGPSPPGAVDPIHEYLHTGTRTVSSVTGGYVYRGPIEALQGQYFFADAVTDEIWSITFDGSDPADFDGSNTASFIDWTAMLTPPGGIGTIASFGEDLEGNLYLVDLGNPFTDQAFGAIYKLVELPVPEPGTAALLALGLAMLGRFSDLRSAAPRCAPRVAPLAQTTAPPSRSRSRRAAS